MKFNIEGFESICKSTQEDLLEYLGKQTPDLYGKDNCVITEDYIFAKGEIPVCLVCHLDTVHTELPQIIIADPRNGLIWSPQGIGADDRAGLYAIIHIINNIGDKKPSVLFTTDEETGGCGAKKAAPELVSKVNGINFLIEFDRKNSNDAVFYNGKNQEFIKYIESFGFKEQYGSYSDIATLSPKWGMASVNLSVGYYNAHTKNEMLNSKQLMATVEKAMNILKDDGVSTFYKHITASVSTTNKYNNYDDYEDYLGKKYGEKNVKDPFWYD